MAERYGNGTMRSGDLSERPPTLTAGGFLDTDAAMPGEPVRIDGDDVALDTQTRGNLPGCRRLGGRRRAQPVVDVDRAHGDEPGPPERHQHGEERQGVGTTREPNEHLGPGRNAGLTQSMTNPLNKAVLARAARRRAGPEIIQVLTHGDSEEEGGADGWNRTTGQGLMSPLLYL